MVLEHLFPETWLEKRFSMALLLGAGFTLVGVILARLLFGANSGIVAVFFVSLLLIPSLKKLFQEEDQLEERERKFSFKELWKDNKHLILTYLGMFIGVYIATYLITYFSYYLGADPTAIFREQLYLEPAISGRATFWSGVFWDILINNWWVLLAAFLLALISGDGATFFIVWNASAWAAIFAFRSFAAASILPAGFLEVAILLQLIVLPHLLIEGLAYILSGIAGAVISQDVVSESSELKDFLAYFSLGLVVFVFLNFTFSQLFTGAILFISRLLLTLGIVWSFHHAFKVKKHKEVFLYNYWLFIVAIIVFLLGVGVETLVLTNSDLLLEYYRAAARF